MTDAVELLEACVRQRIMDSFEVRGDRIAIVHGRDRHELSAERAASYARGILRHADTLRLLAITAGRSVLAEK